MKKVLTITPSLRQGSNPEALDVFAGGVNEPDETEGHPALSEAYATGWNIR